MELDSILRLPELLQVTDCRAPWHSSLRLGAAESVRRGSAVTR